VTLVTAISADTAYSQAGSIMPIKSYLAFPRPGQRDSLAWILSQIPHCNVIPASNREVIVLVTDTPDNASEKRLEERFQQVEPLQFLSLVAGAEVQA
jgi:hypothetical protein